jgi:hypothetical protein
MPLNDPSDLRETVARHDEQLKDHDEVIRDLRDHLHDLLGAFNAFQTKVLVAAAIFFAGTPQGQDLLRTLGFG